jgi:hypothetical protein
MNKQRIFISSVQKELADERRVLKECKNGMAEPCFRLDSGCFVLTIIRKSAQKAQVIHDGVHDGVHQWVHDEVQEAQDKAQAAQVNLVAWEKNVLAVAQNSDRTDKQILKIAGYKTRTGNFTKGLQKLIDAGLLAQTLPENPNSSNQMYRITQKGKSLVSGF